MKSAWRGLGSYACRGLGLAAWCGLGLSAAVGLWSSTAIAATTAVAPASAAQHMLSVKVEGRQVLANACRAGQSCDASAGTRFKIPDGVDAARVKTELVVLDPSHRVLLLAFSPKQGPGSWSLLLAANARKDKPEVMKLLSGYTRRPKGRPGAQRTAVLLREKQGRGTRVTVARSYENASVCGRPAWMNARQLDPATLQWQAAPTRGLHPDDRAAAVPLTARRADAQPFDPQHVRVLSSEVASSALKRNRATIADRDLTTRWAEARPDDGSGEFIGFGMPKNVPIKGVRVAFRPTGKEVSGAAPRSFYLATREKVFRVTMPEDAWQQPPASAYAIDFPAPIRTDCLALVLDKAYGEDSAPVVSVAELRAHTSFDALKGDYGKLVEQLGGESAQAEQAKALLMRGGDAAVKAAQNGFDALPRRARVDAMTVIDTGSCSATAPFFVDRLLGKGGGADFDPDIDPLASHARNRLRQCRGASMPLLVTALKERVGKERAWAASQLALLSAKDAARAIPDQLAEPQPDVRLELRKALALAAKHKRAKPVLEAMLSAPTFPQRPLIARIDLLRALGDSIVDYAPASSALVAVLKSDDTFRTRYLLLEPAARLAGAGDEPAMAVLRDTMAQHNSPHMRAHAARLGGPVPKLSPAAVAALGDKHPRVRSAALQGLSASPQPLPAAARSRSLVLLQSDPWTFVRAEAATALGAQGPDPKLDEALIEALEDKAWPVRQAVLRALGKRNSQSASDRIHDIADNPKEATDVRAAAIAALGELCHRDSAELLYKLALRAGYPQLPYDQPLGLAALAALGDIKPPDLARRLAPLLARDPRIPRVIRSITRDTLRRQGRCGAQNNAI